MTTFDSASALAAVVSIDPDVAEFQATLPILVERASRALLEARSSAEVLEARDMATVAYDAAKSAGRLARAKKAHEAIIAAVYRAQADALLIEARAKMRLADEYDAAQERGEVKSHGGSRVNVPDRNVAPSAAEVGLSRKEIHEGRKLRDAEKVNPGKAERVLKEVADRGEEPTKAKLRKEVTPDAPAPAKADVTPLDPERRKLAKLTPDALIDEVLGLRADLTEAKAEAAKLKAERDALKAQVKDLSATDHGATIRKLQAEADNAKNGKWREGERAIAFQKQIYALKKELKSIGATEIPL